MTVLYPNCVIMRHVIKRLYCTHLRDESNRIIPIRYIFNDKLLNAVHDTIFSGKEFVPSNEIIKVECTYTYYNKVVNV